MMMEKFDQMQSDLEKMRKKLEEYEVEGSHQEADQIKSEIRKQEKSLKKEKEKTVRILRKTTKKVGLNESTKRFLIAAMNRPEYIGTHF